MSQKEIQESLELLEKDWDVDPIRNAAFANSFFFSGLYRYGA